MLEFCQWQRVDSAKQLPRGFFHDEENRKMPRRELHFREQEALSISVFRFGIALREDACSRHAVDALIYAMLSVTRIEEGWSRWRFAMQSNYSTGTARGEQRWCAERKKKKVQELLTSGKKLTAKICEYPFRPSRTRKEGAFNFQARFMMAVREN